MLHLFLLPLLTPLAFSHPTPPTLLLPRAAESACSLAVRTGFTWTATNFTSSTPSPVAVAFTLTNSALDYTHACAGVASVASPFDGTYWFECAGDKGSASFSYDAGTGRVGVRQGWECDNGVKGRPYYIAEGVGMVAGGVAVADVVIGLETIRGIL
ncbi:hypothetical protein B0T18DRAFT_426400 [Schizothecium vesticola]|uniref:AA1-like domain-containing protein n=1 Tax=Schizothecium vesticola TaxID=314040 RepID=A0AA40KAJ7_9PEZI|nr:hypothetical protein B0T18DRAFT_426400 [Schizothecium vesticola]